MTANRIRLPLILQPVAESGCLLREIDREGLRVARTVLHSQEPPKTESPWVQPEALETSDHQEVDLASKKLGQPARGCKPQKKPDLRAKAERALDKLFGRWDGSAYDAAERRETLIDLMVRFARDSYQSIFDEKARERWANFKPPRHPDQDVWDAVTERIKNMTPEEFRQSMVDAGIDNPDGTLTEEYGGEPRKGRKP